MKIVVLTTGHRPDDDRIYYKEIISLLTRYPRIDLVAPVVKGEAYNLDAGVVLHPLRKRSGMVGRLLTAFAAAMKVIQLKPDICHFHDLDFVLMVPFVRLLGNAKIVYDVHEVYPESMLISTKIPRGFRRIIATVVNILEKGSARLCSLVITADTPNSESFEKTSVPTVTLFNYPRLSLFEPDNKRLTELRENYAGRRVLIYQGTMGRDRGLFHMLDGMCILKESVPEALLLLVGLNDDELRSKVDEQIRRNGLDDSIEIITWVPHADIALYIAMAEVGLAPLQPNPKFEKNIPIKIFEYMACGIPLLAADLRAVAHFITDSGAGVLYDSTDAGAFAQKAELILNDHRGRESMSQAGKNAITRSWNWAEMEKILLTAYKELEQA